MPSFCFAFTVSAPLVASGSPQADKHCESLSDNDISPRQSPFTLLLVIRNKYVKYGP